MRYLPLLFWVFFYGSCQEDEPTDNPTPEQQPNILLIIADDLGKDALQGFAEGTIKPNTPNLDELRNRGLVFTNTWVNPTCSPTRAAIITGKYGYRTGVKWASDVLPPSEKTIQQYINEETNNAYATALIGKWHLSGNNTNADPESFGIDYFAGLIRGSANNYYDWQFTEDGNTSTNNQYTTKVFTDLSMDWISSQSKPWFLWLAYNAPHTPYHVPPNAMHTQGSLPNYADGLDPTPYYMAAIEAIDFQIGRLIASIPQEELDNTIILFVGDNGSPGAVAQSPFSNQKAKGSLYQGGVNVPMFVSGKGVNRTGEDDNLIGATDFFTTIAELAGVNTSSIHDSKSFKSLLETPSTIRNFQYAEKDDGTDDSWAISNGNFKLIVNANGDEEFYHLANDPYENNNLLNGNLSAAEQSAKTELETELGIIRN